MIGFENTNRSRNFTTRERSRDKLVTSFLSREYQQRTEASKTVLRENTFPFKRMLSFDRNDILRYLSSSDEGGLLIGHTDVLSRAEEHGGRQVHVEVRYSVW